MSAALHPHKLQTRTYSAIHSGRRCKAPENFQGRLAECSGMSWHSKSGERESCPASIEVSRHN